MDNHDLCVYDYDKLHLWLCEEYGTLKNRELIEFLQMYDPDAQVFFGSRTPFQLKGEPVCYELQKLKPEYRSLVKVHMSYVPPKFYYQDNVIILENE